MKFELAQEHHWLQKLVGAWDVEHGAGGCGPDAATAETANAEPPATPFRGMETVRSLGGFFVVAEGAGDMPGFGPVSTIMTLGFDASQGGYVGTWVGSMMPNLWVYRGTLDGDTLTLESEGPSMGGTGEIAPYRDIITFHDPDYRTMTSLSPGPDGEWKAFMTVHYRRKK
jgi:hypothetical protein